SLVVMNSLLQYEGMGGQVQMIYIDPPYGVKFGSNFQPFVRKRDVYHNDDEDMTREPEMVQTTQDFLLWYARDKDRVKFRPIYTDKSIAAEDDSHYMRDDNDDL